MDSALLLAGEKTGDPDRLTGDVDGEPAIRRIATALPSTVDEVVVSCDECQREVIAELLSDVDYRLAIEPVPAGGPVAALRTGFRVANGSAVAVLDCAAPIDGDLLDALFDAVDTAAVPQIGDSLFPLHAVYDRYSGRQAAERTLATGSRRLYDLLAQLDPVLVDAAAASDGDCPLVGEHSRAGATTVCGDPSG